MIILTRDQTATHNQQQSTLDPGPPSGLSPGRTAFYIQINIDQSFQWLAASSDGDIRISEDLPVWNIW